MKNTDRFTGKAGAYAQGRPGYPSAVVKLLTQETRRENPRMADIGSGTGILSRAMLERGWTVYGVEPNDDMRKEAEKTLNGFSRFHSVAGTAEHTRLSGASVDLVTSAQAFHWFDAFAFKRECRRILTGEGRIALIWNSRVEDSPIVREEGSIHRLYCPRFYGFSGGLAELTDSIGAFFGHRFRVFRFPNNLSYTRDQYLRRMMSASYALMENGEGRSSWLAALDGLFDRFETEGRVTVPNETVVYLGKC
ncbi:MAG: class I SAM-dependent methyltransferase [Akkermansia sp.]